MIVNRFRILQSLQIKQYVQKNELENINKQLKGIDHHPVEIVDEEAYMIQYDSNDIRATRMILRLMKDDLRYIPSPEFSLALARMRKWMDH